MKIAEIRARESKATLGPWAWDNRGDKCDEIQIGAAVGEDDLPIKGEIPDDNTKVVYIEGIAEAVNSNADADFIAHARQDIPDLLDALEEAIGLLEKAQNGVEGASPLGKWIKAFLTKHGSKL